MPRQTLRRLLAYLGAAAQRSGARHAQRGALHCATRAPLLHATTLWARWLDKRSPGDSGVRADVHLSGMVRRHWRKRRGAAGRLRLWTARGERAAGNGFYTAFPRHARYLLHLLAVLFVSDIARCRAVTIPAAGSRRRDSPTAWWRLRAALLLRRALALLPFCQHRALRLRVPVRRWMHRGALLDAFSGSCAGGCV